MKDQSKPSPRGASVLFLSWFYTGKSPWAPGTMGSLATLPLILLLDYFNLSFYFLIGLISLFYFLAVVLTQKIQNEFHLHDPQWIVIDEVIGMLITWAFVFKVDVYSLSMVFFLFRFFDIIKIWPASYFDRLHHGIGTITDDVISALYAGISIKILQNFF
jgi:phosphatidylglycerophosphatase A